MQESRTGYCPVHERDITVEVEVSLMRVIGTKTLQKKISGEKCSVWEPARHECSNCPVVHGTSAEMP